MTGNQNYPARSVKSSIVCRKEKVFQQKPLEKTNFIVKMTCPAMVLPTSSDKWKVPFYKCIKFLRATYHQKVTPATWQRWLINLGFIYIFFLR